MASFNFVGRRRVWYGFSVLLFVLSVAAFGLWRLRLGIDFTGGSLAEFHFSNGRPAVEAVREAIPESLGHATITPVGADGYILRLKTISESEHQQLLDAVRKGVPAEQGGDKLVETRFTTIGPTIGAELRQKAISAIGAVLLAIVLYIAWAFRKVSRPVPSWQYGLAAIVALLHDVFIPVGIFAALGHFAGVEIDTLFITALLTVLGFSVHDTIVVFDRVRENLLRTSDDFATVVNSSLNETLARSINTSVTTLLVLTFAIIFGGGSIRYFVLTLIIGIVAGTYSSIFVAAPLLVTFHEWKKKRLGK